MAILGKEVAVLGVDELEPHPHQPRRFSWERDKDALIELSDSIKEVGVIQPVTVRRMPQGQGQKPYQIVAGERRWRASRLAGRDTIRAIIGIYTDTEVFALALIENIQRQALSPIEEANGIQRLMQEEVLTAPEAAARIGKDRTSVIHLVNLLSLEPQIQDLLQNRQLKTGHGKALHAMPPGGRRIELARLAVRDSLSVRELERRVREAAKPQPKTRPERMNADLKHLQGMLSEHLGAQVAVEHQSSGKGRIVISYASLDDCDRLLEHLLSRRANLG